MTLETKRLGNLGEKIAAKYLKKQGYKILGQNFRYKKYGEIDIVAKKKNTKDLVFIEVKTRHREKSKEITSNYSPEDNITYFKQKQLIKLAKIYLAQNLAEDKVKAYLPWQIDIIAIEIDPISQKSNLRHIKQAIGDFC